MTNLDFQMYFASAIFIGMTVTCLYFINRVVEKETKRIKKKPH